MKKKVRKAKGAKKERVAGKKGALRGRISYGIGRSIARAEEMIRGVRKGLVGKGEQNESENVKEARRIRT